MSHDQEIDGAKLAALIISKMPPEQQERIVKSIQSKQPAIAAKLEKNLYKFEKIAELHDQAVQNLVREVKHTDLVVSLKGADEKVKGRLFDNMSESKQRLVEDDYNDLPSMKISDVQAAQRRILKKLEELYPEPTKEERKKTIPRLA